MLKDIYTLITIRYRATFGDVTRDIVYLSCVYFTDTEKLVLSKVLDFFIPPSRVRYGGSCFRV